MTLDEIENEVNLFNNEIIKLISKNQELEKIYKGVQIYFSPIQIKPNIMFLGINPGQGYYVQNSKPVLKLKPLLQHEYIENPFYNLSEDWNYVFRELNAKSKLLGSFKTNCYYFATSNTRELNHMKKILSSYIANDFDDNAKRWTNEIVNIINPRILICEGFIAFSRLLKSLENEYTELQEFKTYKTAKVKNMIILCFKRDVSSRLVNIEEVIEMVECYL